MARPVSNNREKCRSGDTGGVWCRAASKRFRIGISIAIDWVRRVTRRTAQPGRMSSHKPRTAVAYLSHRADSCAIS